MPLRDIITLMNNYNKSNKYSDWKVINVLGLYWRNTQSRFGGDPRGDDKDYLRANCLCVCSIYTYMQHVLYIICI